jgi:hypothetical protein
MAQVTGEAMWRGLSVSWVLPVCAIAGLLFMVLQDWRTRLVSVSLGLGIVASVKPVAMMFAVLLLPLALSWAGAGLANFFPRQRRLLHAAVFIAVIYVLTILPALHAVMALPCQPLREVATAALQATPDSRTITATFPSTGDARLYDREVHIIESITELNGLIDVAYEEDRPFFVYHRLGERYPADWEEIREELEKSGRFQLLQEFAGIEAQEGCRLYRYQPKEKIIHLNLKPEK